MKLKQSNIRFRIPARILRLAVPDEITASRGHPVAGSDKS
jgi:hypothetical protein